MEHFMEMNCKKINQKEFKVKKVTKKKGDKLYVKWKGYNRSLTVGLIKKTYKWVFFSSKTEILGNKSESWIRFI